ncbi:MAG: hypothetical protein ACJAUV_001432 [Flavobacteriales bacterium]|jgi:hypothetical protein
MKSWFPILLLLVIVSCKKPEEEVVEVIKPSVTFDVKDPSGTIREWQSSSAFAKRSENAFQLFAFNTEGEQLNVLMLGSEAGRFKLDNNEHNFVKFNRIKAGENISYTTNRSKYTTGNIYITEVNAVKKTISGNFEMRPHHTDNEYVELKVGLFSNVPYTNELITPGELEIANPIDTITPPIDTTICNFGPNCLSATIGGMPFKSNGSSQVSIERDTLGRMIFKAYGNNNDLLKISIVSNAGFENQSIYSLGKFTPNKGYYLANGKREVITNGTLQLQFDTTGYAVSGLFSADIKENEVNATTRSITNGLFLGTEITSYSRVVSSSSMIADITGYTFVSDTVKSNQLGGFLNLQGKDFEDLEGIELNFPDTILVGNYPLDNVYQTYYYNYYGFKNKYTTGQLNISVHDKIERFIAGSYSFEALDFTENTTITIQTGSFSKFY